MKFTDLSAFINHLRQSSPDHLSQFYAICLPHSYERKKLMLQCCEGLGEQVPLTTENAYQELLSPSLFNEKRVFLIDELEELDKSELKQLQWGDVRIGPDEIKPVIALRASTTKARRADTIPLRHDLADALGATMPTDAQPTDRVFPSIPKMATFKRDLERAEIAHVDASGRVVDFHSLRYTCGTMLAKAGVAPRIAMEIMRHTDMRLTMNLYTDPRLLDTARAIERMPDLDEQPAAERVVARRTGTDDLPVENFPLMPGQKSIDEKYVRQCPQGAVSVHFRESGHSKPPIKSGVLTGGGGDRTRVP